jgi:tetratricopeptide (TPR) repeat protein
MSGRHWILVVGLLPIGLCGLAYWQVQRMVHQATRDLKEAEEAWQRSDRQAVRTLAQAAAANGSASQQVREQAWSLAGRSYLFDSALPRSESLPLAMSFLTQVPANSRFFPEVAVALADDKLFNGRNLKEAEQWVAEGVRWHPGDWRLRNWRINRAAIDGRLPLVEADFLATDPMIPGADPETFLRNWLLCHFCPLTVETEFDRRFGVAGQSEQTNDAIRLERWVTLNRMQLQNPGYYAAIAQWYLERSQPTVAWEYLQAGQSVAEDRPDALYLSVLVRALCEAGKIDDARRVLVPLLQLPPNYWQHVAQARLALAEQRTELAIEKLEVARKIWPGRLDEWVSATLEQLYRSSGDATALEQADALLAERRWLQTQQPIVARAVQQFTDPESRRQLVDLFNALERPVELEWLNRIGREP